MESDMRKKSPITQFYDPVKFGQCDAEKRNGDRCTRNAFDTRQYRDGQTYAICRAHRHSFRPWRGG